jgi:hypothetical protein
VGEREKLQVTKMNGKYERWMLALNIGQTAKEIDQFKNAIKKLAERNNRNISGQIVQILQEELESEGLL